MTGRMRFAPCNVPDCPNLALRQGRCDLHAPAPWSGRNGSSRQRATGLNATASAKLRRAALRRDRGWCRRCGQTATEVDHVVPTAWRTPPTTWSAHLAGLMALCRRCHGDKTQREAALGRAYGSPPPNHVIDMHVQRWLEEVRGAPV